MKILDLYLEGKSKEDVKLPVISAESWKGRYK